MVEVSLTIGKLDASLALLLTKDHHLIEFPTILLPDGVVAGSVVKIRCDRDLELEEKENEEFNNIQQEILSTFGEKLPKAPVLKIRNITQTSCVLEWDKLDLATSTIKSLNLYKDGVRLGQIPNPLQNTTTKLSGLPVDTQYKFQLKLSTTAGVFKSDEVIVKTHKMTDLSGITVCLGEIDDPNITREKIEDSLAKMNAKPLQDKVLVDTTHFICTKPIGREWKKLLDSNIPIVRPEWLKLCELERRIIGVRMFYLDADDDVLKQRDYWGSGEPTKPLPKQPEVNGIPQETPQELKLELEPALEVPPAPELELELEPALELPPAPELELEPVLEIPPAPELELELEPGKPVGELEEVTSNGVADATVNEAIPSEEIVSEETTTKFEEVELSSSDTAPVVEEQVLEPVVEDDVINSEREVNVDEVKTEETSVEEANDESKLDDVPLGENNDESKLDDIPLTEPVDESKLDEVPLEESKEEDEVESNGVKDEEITENEPTLEQEDGGEGDEEIKDDVENAKLNGNSTKNKNKNKNKKKKGKK